MKSRSSTRENQTPVIERAYQLARTGAFATLSEIADRLEPEGYSATAVDIHLEGRKIRGDCDDLSRRRRGKE